MSKAEPLWPDPGGPEAVRRAWRHRGLRPRWRQARRTCAPLSPSPGRRPSPGLRSREGLDEGEHLAFSGEATQLALRVEQVLPVPHLEDAATAGDQAHMPDAVGDRLLRRGRLPGGPFVVASGGAVLDAEVVWLGHRAESSFLPSCRLAPGARRAPRHR